MSFIISMDRQEGPIVHIILVLAKTSLIKRLVFGITGYGYVFKVKQCAFGLWPHPIVHHPWLPGEPCLATKPWVRSPVEDGVPAIFARYVSPSFSM